MHTRAEAFAEAAIRSAGLSDFGGDEFMVALRVLCADLSVSDLEPAWAATLEGVIGSNLEKRLRLVAARRAIPAIAQERIRRPLFVIGLPRTGTSALVDLLAQDPAMRAPLQWETAHLTELNNAGSWHDDPRIEVMEEYLRDQRNINPVVALGLHTYGARLPDECNTFMGMTLWTPNISVFGHLPRYSEWMRFASVPGVYRLHRWVLQHLQYFGRDGQWLLKSPFHVFDLPGILSEYPDAIFVQTHRDPLQLMPSMCGLYSTIRGEGAGHPGRIQTGRELESLWGMGMQRALAARQDPAVDERVFDIAHRDLLTDPLNAVRAVYEKFDIPLGVEAEMAMRRWIDEPAQHLSSVKFDPAHFGLDSRSVERSFGAYRKRFGALF